MNAPIRLISARRRAAIETEIEMHLQRVDLLLARLDRADAPFEDLEDNNDREAVNEDAEGHFGKGLHSILPSYAVDQSPGPINHLTAERALQRRRAAQ